MVKHTFKILQQMLQNFYCVHSIFRDTDQWCEKKLRPIIMDKIIGKKKTINQVKLDEMEKATHIKLLRKFCLPLAKFCY